MEMSGHMYQAANNLEANKSSVNTLEINKPINITSD